MTFQKHDGGRQISGFKGKCGDCVVRAFAIAIQKPYRAVYNELQKRQKSYMKSIGKRHYGVRNGVKPEVWIRYAWKLGFACQVYTKSWEDVLKLSGTFLVVNKGHLTAVINGTIYDDVNPIHNQVEKVYKLRRIKNEFNS